MKRNDYTAGCNCAEAAGTLSCSDISDGKWIFASLSEKPQPIISEALPWFSMQGVFIQKQQEQVSIYTDMFGTVPVFLEIQTGRLASDWASFSTGTAEINLDIPAFWEGIIYDYALSTRTTMRGILQVPGGGYIKYNSHSKVYSVHRWEHFRAETGEYAVEKTISDIENNLKAICTRYWAGLSNNGRILLPLSGGLDSRLLGTYLAKTGDPQRIDAITFGAFESTFENRIAKAVCKGLGIVSHQFFQIERSAYSDQSKAFWRLWRGCLSTSHIHLYSYLASRDIDQELLVSGFFADPVAGYAAAPLGKMRENLEATSAFQRLDVRCTQLRISKEIRYSILEDLNCAYKDWVSASSGMKFDEYLYFTQRQAKTYALLLQSYRGFLPIAAPFSERTLVSLFLKLPYELRANKEIIRVLLRRKASEVADIMDISSSTGGGNRARGLVRKWSTRVANMVGLLSGERLRYFSPYWTEDLNNAFRRECRPQIRATVAYLRANGVISAVQARVFDRKPIRNYEVAHCGRLLSLYPAMVANLGAAVSEN